MVPSAHAVPEGCGHDLSRAAGLFGRLLVPLPEGAVNGESRSEGSGVVAGPHVGVVSDLPGVAEAGEEALDSWAALQPAALGEEGEVVLYRKPGAAVGAPAVVVRYSDVDAGADADAAVDVDVEDHNDAVAEDEVLVHMMAAAAAAALMCSGRHGYTVGLQPETEANTLVVVDSRNPDDVGGAAEGAVAHMVAASGLL